MIEQNFIPQEIVGELNEIHAVLLSYKEMIDALIANAETQKNEIDELRRVMYDDILTPAKAALEESKKEQRYDEWHERHGEVLDPYNERLRLIEGEDFDLSRQTMDGYEGLEVEQKPTEDEYVQEVVSKVESQLDAIKQALGADTVTAEVKENGTTTVTAETDDKQQTLDFSGDGTDNPQDIAELEKELEQYK